MPLWLIGRTNFLGLWGSGGLALTTLSGVHTFLVIIPAALFIEGHSVTLSKMGMFRLILSFHLLLLRGLIVMRFQVIRAHHFHRVLFHKVSFRLRLLIRSLSEPYLWSRVVRILGFLFLRLHVLNNVATELMIFARITWKYVRWIFWTRRAICYILRLRLGIKPSTILSWRSALRNTTSILLIISSIISS